MLQLNIKPAPDTYDKTMIPLRLPGQAEFKITWTSSRQDCPDSEPKVYLQPVVFRSPGIQPMPSLVDQRLPHVLDTTTHINYRFRQKV